MISYAGKARIDKMKIFLKNRNKSLIFLKKYDILILQRLFAYVRQHENRMKIKEIYAAFSAVKG